MNNLTTGRLFIGLTAPEGGFAPRQEFWVASRGRDPYHTIMNTTNSVVPASPADAAALHAFEKRCFPNPVDVFSVPRLAYLLRSPTAKTLVIRASTGRDRLVGAVIGLLRHFRVPSGRIYKIGIDPRQQSKGYATALLAAMETCFRKAGMRKVCAEVRVSNQASQALFAKNGYSKTSILPRYYDDGEDGVKFWKSLRPGRRHGRTP
jgi:ribosomal protein S18 acetylase RimI-like enzyme